MTIWPFRRTGNQLLPFRGLYQRVVGNPSSEILALFGRLREAELHLERDSKALEGQFLATSYELERLKGFGDQFVEDVEKLVGVATGRDCDTTAFSSGIQLIERTTKFLTECQQETDQMLEILRSYQAQIGQLLGVEVELQRAMLPLKCVKTLFKVEAAPLGDAFQQMFGDLTQEMEGLQEQVREIFGTKFKQLNKTRQTIARVIAQLDAQSTVMREVISTHQAQIELSIEALKRELAANQLRDSSLRVLGTNLAHEIDQIVMGLQFQDIINQKLQHVAQALPLIQTRFSAKSSAKSKPAHHRFQVLRQSCRVEASQLQAVRKDLAAAETSIQDGIRRVMECLRDVDSQCLSLKEFEKLTTSCDGTVETLVETIGEVRELVTTAVLRASEAYELLRPLGGFASDLTGSVREMSARINLIGLNAQIQAAQACKDRTGSGLDVLSQRTYDIARETSRISQAVAMRLDGLANGLCSSVRSFEELRANGLEQQSLLGEEGRSEEDKLHAIRDAALQALVSIGQSLDGIKVQAARTLENVNFAKFYQETVPSLEAPLVAIAAKAEGLLISRRQALDHDNLVADLRSNYTMASERHVFDAFVARDGQRETRPASQPAVAPVDMELFAKPSERATLQSVGSAAPTVRMQTAASSGESLGSNVELF